MPDANAASAPGDVPNVRGVDGGSLHLPLSPVTADRLRPWAVASVVVAAAGLALAAGMSYAAVLALTIALSLGLAWSWPVLGGSRTPAATSGVLAASAVAIVLSALREDLRWIAAAVAFGIVLSFFAQLVRRTGREDLVLTLLASFGGLVLMASGTLAVVASDTDHGPALMGVAMAGVLGAAVADVLAGVRRAVPLLGIVALLGAALGGLVSGLWQDEFRGLAAIGLAAAAGTVSWSFRRVMVLQPAMMSARGQLAAGIGSVLLSGAIVRLFSLLA